MELIARVFAAMELKLDFIQSKPNESQSNLLQSNYEKKLKELRIPDPTTVRVNAADDVTIWPQVTLGVGYHKEGLTHLFLGGARVLALLVLAMYLLIF